MDSRGRTEISAGRFWSLALGCLLAVGAGGATPAVVRAQVDTGPSNSEPSWARRYLPPSDGLLELRYGMDRGTVDATLRARGLKSRRASRADQLRFEGPVLGAPAEVVTSFLGEDRDGRQRLARIEVRWRYDGALRAPRRIFESLEGLLGRRYGDAVSRQDDAWAAISNGSGRRGRVYVGPETEALLEIRGIRKDVVRVDLRLEFPPWADQL